MTPQCDAACCRSRIGLKEEVTRHGTACLLLLLSSFLIAGANGASAVFRERQAPLGGLLYYVNTTSDTVTAGACANGLANCSLRGAMQAANSHPGEDGIEFSLPAGSVINLTQALPGITDGLTIFGPGASQLTVRRNSGGDYRIFKVAFPAQVAVTLSGLTISNGRSTFSVTEEDAGGGGIANNSQSTVNVTNCVLIGNSAPGAAGGAIFNYNGTMNVSGCTLSGNSSQSGGGIANASGVTAGTLNVSSSLIRDNTVSQADSGGGISNSAITTISNSTLSGNRAGTGGGIRNSGTLTVTNSTVAGNVATFLNGGGIANSSANPVNVKSTIVALNTAPPGNVSDVGGAFLSHGFNLIGKTDGSTGFNQATDVVGTEAVPRNPKLDPAGLQHNGGPTQTIALLPGSPALDQGTSNGLTGSLTSDQRGNGFARTADYSNIGNAAGVDGTDIGAVEGTALEITAITRQPNAVLLIQGRGTPNRPHTVEASADLDPNSYVAFPNQINADGTGALQQQDTPPSSARKRFYRLRFP